MTGKRFDIGQFTAGRPTVTVGVPRFGIVAPLAAAGTLGTGSPVGEPPVTGHAPQPPATARPLLDARSLDGKPVRVVEDFISGEECATLVNYARQPEAPWAVDLDPGNIWYARMIHPHSMSPPILALMERIRTRAAKHIKADYEIDASVFSDTLQIVRWRPGDQQAPHADCEELDGRPNPFPWRAFASIIYLNDEYEGGQIHFPELGLRPRTPPGSIAYFPSTRNYLHGVEPVTAGTRYTIGCFYTFDRNRADGYAV